MVEAVCKHLKKRSQQYLRHDVKTQTKQDDSHRRTIVFQRWNVNFLLTATVAGHKQPNMDGLMTHSGDVSIGCYYLLGGVDWTGLDHGSDCTVCPYIAT